MFFVIENFDGHLLTIWHSLRGESQELQDLQFPAQPCEMAREGVATVHSRPGGPRAPAQQPLVQDERGAWSQCVAVFTLHMRAFPYLLI